MNLRAPISEIVLKKNVVSLPQKPEKGRMRVHHLNNVSTAFRVLDRNNVGR